MFVIPGELLVNIVCLLKAPVENIKICGHKHQEHESVFHWKTIIVAYKTPARAGGITIAIFVPIAIQSFKNCLGVIDRERHIPEIVKNIVGSVLVFPHDQVSRDSEFAFATIDRMTSRLGSVGSGLIQFHGPYKDLCKSR